MIFDAGIFDMATAHFPPWSNDWVALHPPNLPSRKKCVSKLRHVLCRNKPAICVLGEFAASSTRRSSSTSSRAFLAPCVAALPNVTKPDGVRRWRAPRPAAAAAAAAVATAVRNMNMTTSDSALAAVPRFVKTLYDMLQNEDQRILSWSVDGSHFQVYDVPQLETEVLRKYFKHGKFSSFQRQLNNFGFHKWTKTRASVATFSHDVLVRCHPSELAGLASQMKMKATAATRLAAATSAKRPHGLLATPVEQSPAVKRQKMSPRDISAIDDLAGMSFASTAEPLWSLDGGCCNDELLLSTLDSVELANLAELDWEAALLPLERDERRGDGDIDIDSDIA
ncbi:unnamed protein product [Phytophthora lilii]|uniref:Unnamed protein product n=1 Tax=Phytophthora lilii TaxID=2077276 RepID=A0A9W6X6B5_9STRA|nr:unnamed protein product [Phytophthora lilii]